MSVAWWQALFQRGTCMLFICEVSHAAFCRAAGDVGHRRACAERRPRRHRAGGGDRTVHHLAGRKEQPRRSQQGAKLYFDEINATGGVLGRRIVLRTLDDNNQSAVAESNARQLLQDGAFLLFGSIEGGPGDESRPRCQRALHGHGGPPCAPACPRAARLAGAEHRPAQRRIPPCRQCQRPRAPPSQAPAGWAWSGPALQADADAAPPCWSSRSPGQARMMLNHGSPPFTS
ncbi:MAG: ABC transporter substrate-binding protein [Ideonella sp.]|nr:ABC transporter substrate-binding protein [Ideonella sp.]